MEFRQLSYFVAVVDTGSISAASRQVHIAQPALTRQIRLLEEDLGTRLLERHPRGVSPTVAGKALYSEAMQLLDTRSRMRTKLSELGQGVIGKVSLGVTVTHLWVPEISMLLRHYRDRYRKVAFEVFPLLSGPQRRTRNVAVGENATITAGRSQRYGFCLGLPEYFSTVLRPRHGAL